MLAVVSGLLAVATHAAEITDHNWQRFTPVPVAAVDGSPLPERLNAAPRVSLVTDLPADVANSLLQQLGQFDALVDQYVGPFIPLANDIAPSMASRPASATQRETLHLLVLRRRKDFLRLFRPGHFSAFTLPTLDKTVLVVGPMGQSDSLRENLLHEYVHYRLRRDVPGGLPLWFEEGLASFLSEVSSTDKDPYLADGIFVRRHTRTMGSGRLRQRQSGADLQELIARRDLVGLNRDEVFGFYRASHAFVRYLYTQATVDPAVLARALVLGQPKFPDGVGVDLRQVARALRALLPGWQVGPFSRLLAGGDGAVMAPVFTAVAATVPMRPNEVRAELANAALLMNPKRALALYADITAEDPDNLHALLGALQAHRAQSDMEAARALLSRALQLAPELPEVLVAKAAMGTSGCIVKSEPHCVSGWRSAMIALRNALDVQPENYEAIYRLGLSHLYLGQPGAAQGYLEVSWQRVPWSPRVNFFLGEAMRLAGDTRARWYLSNAQRWSANDYFRTAAELALARVDESLAATANGGPQE